MQVHLVAGQKVEAFNLFPKCHFVRYIDLTFSPIQSVASHVNSISLYFRFWFHGRRCPKSLNNHKGFDSWRRLCHWWTVKFVFWRCEMLVADLCVCQVIRLVKWHWLRSCLLVSVAYGCHFCTVLRADFEDLTLSVWHSFAVIGMIGDHVSDRKGISGISNRVISEYGWWWWSVWPMIRHVWWW
jgi:hypothetical protein